MSSYLQRMGITEWRLRENTEDNDYFIVTLNNAAGKTVGLMLADVDNNTAIAEQAELLQKIAKALTPYSDYKIFPAFPADKIENNEYRFMIILGDTLKKMHASQPTCQLVESFSLVDLLHNENHKKQLWTEIKPLRELMG